MGKTYQSTVIPAPIEKLWPAIRNFHDLSWAPNVITACEAVGNLKGDQIGARRILNDAFHETLLELSDLAHTVKYSIDDGPSPVSKTDVHKYIGVIKVRAVTDINGSFVEWSSSWEGKEDAYEFCHNIYLALLADMKKFFGG